MGQRILGVIIAVIVGTIAYNLVSRTAGGFFGGMKVRHMPDAAVMLGWRKFDAARHGFSIQIPTEFVAFDPKGPEMEAVIQEATKQNPAASPTLRQMAASGDFALMAFDVKNVVNDFATNVNALRKTVGGNFVKSDGNLQQFRKGVEDQLPPGSKIMKIEYVEIPIGTAIHTEILMKLNGASGTAECYALGYAIPDGSDLYNVTYSGDASLVDKLRSTAAQSIQTFRVDR
ncbi:MAG: hypothetical protein IT203_11795 [Fimbriimonadaceae bacterium]|nr:hypothetical protein [Fimbriimonadaceae bacterium]